MESFYISIEDGECTVERDLAEFREAKMVHRTANMDFFDDMLMLKLNGPKSLAECDGNEAHSCSGLTPFSRECASLWRELYGARFGHHNAKATLAAQERRSRSQGFVKQLVECWLPPDSPSLSLVVWPLHGLTQPLARARRAQPLALLRMSFGMRRWTSSRKTLTITSRASWRRAADQARRSFPREVCTSNVMLLLSRSRWCAHPSPRLLSSATPLRNSVDRTPPSLGDIVVLKQTSS